MATQLFANNVITTLAADIDDSQTSLQAAAATGFPAPAAGNWFMIAIFSATTGALLEVVKCTDVTGVTCTIARAQEGTSGTAATTGDILVISPPTKGTFEQIQTDVAANAASASANSAAILLLPTAEAHGVRCLSGCTPSNDTDTDHDINFSAGFHVLTDGAGAYKIFENQSDHCKQTDATWAAGDDAGGMPDALSVSASTMYYCFMLGNPTTGAVGFGFDTSPTAVNLLADAAVVAAGLTYYGIVSGNFVVFTDSSSNIRKFYVARKQVRYLSAIADVNDSTITAGSYETGTITAPPNSVALLLVTTQASAAAGNAGVYVTLQNPTTTEAKTVIQSVAPTVVRITGPAEFNINASRQLQYKGQLYVGDTVDYIGINTGGYLLSS